MASHGIQWVNEKIYSFTVEPDSYYEIVPEGDTSLTGLSCAEDEDRNGTITVQISHATVFTAPIAALMDARIAIPRERADNASSAAAKILSYFAEHPEMGNACIEPIHELLKIVQPMIGFDIPIVARMLFPLKFKLTGRNTPVQMFARVIQSWDIA